MPLLDHFHPPLAPRRNWEGFHGMWIAMMTADLNRRLPERFLAEPQVHLGSAAEIDVATFEEEGQGRPTPAPADSGGVATAVWAPPRPTLSAPSEAPMPQSYSVRVHDLGRARRLVAAVELVSPANKDRPENRRTFVSKCAAMLADLVCVSVVDIVTTRGFNLYGEVLEVLGLTDPALAAEPFDNYAVSARHVRENETWRFEAWTHPLAVGQPLPTLPLWVAEDLAVPLELDASYEETCRALRIG
ncbi:MAG: DUF4058 family protein [Isosphaeraceae bacterium]